MAFTQKKLDRSVLQARGIFNKYIYETEDTISDVFSVDYFANSRFIEIDNDSTNGMGWSGGIVECSCSDGYVIGQISIDGKTITSTSINSLNSFDSLTTAIAYVTANPNAITQLYTASYRNSSECLALGVAFPDGGGAAWIKSEVTGLAPYQSPSQLIKASFSDGEGNEWELNEHGDVFAEMLGAIPLPTEDITPIWNAFKGSELAMKLHNGMTYGTLGIQLAVTHSTIIADEGEHPIIRLMDGANNHTVRGDDCVHPVIKFIIIDGNKANQSVGVGFNNRGLYFLGDTSEEDIEGVIIKNTVDHGLFFSSGATAGRDGAVTRCYAIDCGLQSHIDAGGAGGTGFVGGYQTTVWDSCFATGNLLNGFKSTGKHKGCVSHDNIGGGYETGFNVSDQRLTQYQLCHALDNGGGGFRHQGEVSDLLMDGCSIGGNGEAGITLFNNVVNPTITDCTIFNNGQNGTPDVDNAGSAGIYITATSGEVSGLLIDNNHFFDDQVVKTQTHHIQMFKRATGKIGAGNTYGAALISPISYAAAAFDADIDLEQGRGLSTKLSELEAVTVTGTTSSTVTTSLTIDSSSLPVAMSIPINIIGTSAGASDVKRIRLKLDSTSAIALTIPSADESSWQVDGKIERLGSSIVRLTYDAFSDDGSVSTGSIQVNKSFSSSIFMSVEIQVNNAADSITQYKGKIG